MHKVSRRQRFILTLPGLVLLAAFLISGGAEAFQRETLTAWAAEATVKPPSADSLVVQHSTDCSKEYQAPFFNSAVVVTSGEVVCSDLTSFGGSVTVRGKINGNVVMFGGNVVIDGMVNGNVTVYGGDLTLQDNAQVYGDIHVCGGIWAEGTYSELHGSVISCTKSWGTLLTSNSGANIRFWSVLAWVIFGLLLTSLLPEHVMLVRTTVKSRMRRSFILGLLSVLLAPAILAVLVGLIVSIPLAILVAVGLIIAWVLGTVAVGWIIGAAIVSAVVPQHSSRFLQVMVGMATLALAGSLPYVGLWIMIGSGLVGLGAVFLSRFGTRLYSPARHPL